ncbi:Smr/MutS family protein [Rhodocyclaceae bacterium SMB388]
MTRRPVRSAARTGRNGTGLDGLAKLRGRLEARAESTPRKAGPDRPVASPAEAADDGLTLFHAAVGDVEPLRREPRAEIDRPRPAPVPRSPTAPVEVDARVDAPGRADPVEDELALFLASMQDVLPLKHDDRAETGNGAAGRGRRRPGAPDRPDIDLAALLPAPSESLSAEELFQWAIRGAQPIDIRNRAEVSRPGPAPVPLKRDEDEQAALRETMQAPLSLEDRLEMGDEAAFLRPGLPRRVLTDLRRGRWVRQAELDLHGLNREQARKTLAEFLAACLLRGHRCVRIIHGKGLGSPGKESILKRLARGWLAQRDEILAFCQASPNQGGAGALMVLLRGRSADRH